MECNVCMEKQKQENLSYCITCINAGNICHACLTQWATKGNKPCVCIICKHKSMRNIPYDLWFTYKPHNNVPRLTFFGECILSIYGLIVIIIMVMCSFTITYITIQMGKSMIISTLSMVEDII